MFSGQGSQWLGMGRGLAGRFPVFGGVFDEVVGFFPGLREVVWGSDGGVLGGVGWAQLGLFAFEVALFRLWESWGVVPDVVVGHSVGEVAAAYVAGVLSLGDACRLVSARAGLMEGLSGGGAMAVVRVSEEEVVSCLPEGVVVAAVNAPGSVVVAGEVSAVGVVMGRFAGSRLLDVGGAFHSPWVDPMLAGFGDALGGVVFSDPVIPVVSSVELGMDMATVDYWVSQVRRPVR
ncbi:acyltransferase domain-containing protein, partial [Amycolatopsis antarctica]|uniref:acyltransferase domain-containing protein n=1 Tax=Amycolatopsis antarctica TaxID=1854586 RepID=UPI001F0A3150